MRAAVDDVHHRHGQHARADAAQIAVERRRFGDAAARAVAIETARIAFAPSVPLFGVPSSVDHRAVDQRLLGGIHARAAPARSLR